MTMKLLCWAAFLTVALCNATETDSKNSKSMQDVLDHHGIPRSLQTATCQTRKAGLVCELSTTEGAAIKYTANCPIGFDDASDCLLSPAPLCYQYNGIPCISSLLCGPSGPIANDCSNIFARSTGSNCSATDCDLNCLGLAETPVDYNAADRDNICMRLGFSTLGAEVGPSVEITNEWWHVLADGEEIEVLAKRGISVVNYESCTVTYGASRRPCGCSVDCPVTVPPNIQYDCGAHTDDACAAVDCGGNCVNAAGQAPVPFPPPPPPTAPAPAAEPPAAAPVQAPTAPALGDCELVMHAFEPRELCTTDYANPTESGTIVPDGTCRTAAGRLLPGNYRATCDATGRVRFSESACTSPTCDAASPLEICDRDDTNITPSYLYSAPGLTQGFPVVAEGETQVDCITLTGGGVGAGVTVTFVIRGTCGPECADGSGTTPTAPVPAPTAPIPAPTAPAPAPTMVPPAPKADPTPVPPPSPPTGGSPYGPTTWQAKPVAPGPADPPTDDDSTPTLAAPPVWGPTTWTAQEGANAEDANSGTWTGMSFSGGPLVATALLWVLLAPLLI